jgi:choline dehydrogenase
MQEDFALRVRANQQQLASNLSARFLDLYCRRIEAWTGSPDPGYRCSGGMVHVQPAAEPHHFSIALLEGAESVGLELFPNPNGRMMETAGGCAFVDEIVYGGRSR